MPYVIYTTYDTEFFEHGNSNWCNKEYVVPSLMAARLLIDLTKDNTPIGIATSIIVEEN